MRVSLIFFSCVRIADLPYALLTNPLLLKLSPLSVHLTMSDPLLSSQSSLIWTIFLLIKLLVLLKSQNMQHTPSSFAHSPSDIYFRLLPLSHGNQPS